MIALLILLLAPNVIPNNVMLAYRVFIFGMPINVFDVLIVLAALVSLRTNPDRFQVDRVHPLLPWVCLTLLVAGLGGAAMSAIEGNDLRYFITPTRDFMTLPVAIFIGYRLLHTPRSALVIAYFQIFLSILSAVAVLFFVRSTSLALSEQYGRAFDDLRSTNYAGDVGYSVLSLMLFAIVSRVRIFPRIIELLLIALGIGATFLIPHRGAWVSLYIAIVFAVLILPKQKKMRRFWIFWASKAGLVLVATVGIVVVGSITGRDFQGYVYNRMVSLLPGEHEGVKLHAWDSRIPGTIRELELWARSPIIGRGFGIQDIDLQSHQDMSYRHNTWTSFMAETGVVGLAGVLMLTLGPLVLGWRMARRPIDRGTMLLGALCAIMGFGFFVDAWLSMSFNKQRAALIVGLWCGMAIRARAMHLTESRLWQGYIDADDQAPVDLYSPALSPGHYGAPAHAFHSSY